MHLRKLILLFFLLLTLTGCDETPKELDAGMQLRSQLLQASGCTFSSQITADYYDRLFCFAVDCSVDTNGTVSFTVMQPDSISGISGTLAGVGGQILFDDVALTFPLTAEDLPSPVSTPWILMKALRSGFLTSACQENGQIRLSVDDRYDDEALKVDIWLNQNKLPEHADILIAGKRILTVSVSNFQIS